MKPVIYLLQVTACTGLFYTLYFLLLRRYTFFTINRWYLLGSLLLSFIIPAITIKVKEVPKIRAMQPFVYEQYMQVTDKPIALTTVQQYQTETKQPMDWMFIAQCIYLSFAALLLMRLLFTLVVFAYRIRAEKLLQIGHVQVLKSNRRIGNSSFFNVVFINDEELTADEVRQVLAHELLHVKLMHSADRLIARLAQVVLWFNPFAYAYVRSIEENHEFEVDGKAAANNDRSGYAALLFKLSVSSQSSLFQNFSKAPLKKRVTMLFNQPTNHMKKLMYVLVLPVVVLSCLAFAKLKTDNVYRKPAKIVADTSDINRYKQKDRLKYKNGKVVKKPRSIENYSLTEDFKRKEALSKKVAGKTIKFKVLSAIDSAYGSGPFQHVKGYQLEYDNSFYVLDTKQWHLSALQGKLQAGDEIEVEMRGCLYSKNLPIIVYPAMVVKNGLKLFEITKVDTAHNYAFLYEANRVRYTDGKITNLQKYANGKLKSAVLEVANGYKIKFNIKPSAPEFKDIDPGDQVRFRFVHERKTGAKEYTVDDWVSLTTNIKDYGVKNPDFFFKFYERI